MKLREERVAKQSATEQVIALKAELAVTKQALKKGIKHQWEMKSDIIYYIIHYKMKNTS